MAPDTTTTLAVAYINQSAAQRGRTAPTNEGVYAS